MIGAIEKQKLVYILNRDAAAKLTISSPLEAHKSHTILFDIAALDVGFENPQFVCLEIDYQDSPDNKRLVTYELDLGLNHVVRKHTQQVFYTSNMLIPVPGGSDGPGGVLVCSENMISYMSHGMEPITERIPQRADFYDSQKGLLLVSSATHRQKGMFFFLVQSEFGDLYKVDISYKGGETTGIKVTYFDTVPVGSAISVMKNGCLFVAAEAGDHFLYQFHSIGEEEESMTQVADDGTPLFRPRQLKNLSAVDRLDSFAPILESRVVDTAAQEGGGQQIYALCGTNAQSSLRLIRHGLAVSEMAVSDLPAVPNGIWTIKTNSADSFDTYIVVSFSNGTLVLSIGETVEEVSDAESGFLGENTTLLVSLLGENAIIQVHPTGIRYIRGKDMRIEWKTPHNRVIVHAAANSKQVVIALSGGDLLYFELDDLGQLVEIGKKELGHEVTCLDIAPIPAGRQRSRFLGVGDANNTVRLYSLYPDEDFERLSVLNLTCQPKSLCLLSLPSSFEGESSSSSSFSSSSSPSLSAPQRESRSISPIQELKSSQECDSFQESLKGVKSGTLFKKKKKKRDWVPYYFTLKRKYLFFFESCARNLEFKGALMLKNCSVFAIQMSKPQHQEGFQFAICSQIGTDYFSASSADECKSWIEDIEKCIVNEEGFVGRSTPETEEEFAEVETSFRKQKDMVASKKKNVVKLQMTQKLKEQGVDQSTQGEMFLDDADIIKQGNLHKRGEKVKNWTQRWFALKNNILHYYEVLPTGQLKLKGTIHLVQSVVGHSDRELRMFCFEIHLEYRTYYIAARDDEEEREWIEAILKSTSTCTLQKSEKERERETVVDLDSRDSLEKKADSQKDKKDLKKVNSELYKQKSDSSRQSSMVPEFMRVLSSNELPKMENVEIIRTGYLIKKGAMRKNWTTRYFELRKNTLTYYRSPNEAPKGVIILEAASKVTNLHEKKPFSFTISNSTAREYWVAASDAAQSSLWIETIGWCIEQLGEGDGEKGTGGAVSPTTEKDNE